MKPYDLIRSGLVRRWHANPDLAHSGETNGHHQWVVASLVLALHPDPSPALVREALWHDVGELRAGDLSAPFKDANPEFAGAHAKYEREARSDICGVIWLDRDEARWLKFCDRLAAYLWMLHAAPACAGRQDWRDAKSWMLNEALNLDRCHAVSQLILDHGVADV